MLKLYGRNTSINVQKVAWTMKELGLNWEWVDRRGVVGSIDTEEYRKLNPAGQVPTVSDNGLLLRQSNAIIRYLAKTYGEGSQWPLTN